jgi:hypothetical protein
MDEKQFNVLVVKRKKTVRRTVVLFILVLFGIYFLKNSSDIYKLINKERIVMVKEGKIFDSNQRVVEDIPRSIQNEGAVNNNRAESVENKKEASLGIIEKPVKSGFELSSGRLIDTVIIHTSYNAQGGDKYDLNKLIQEYNNYGVSPHYLIDRTGNIYRLVEEKNIAYHAGESKMPDGRTSVNNFSLGIELINSKKDQLTSSQYNSLKLLLAYIKENNVIKYELGHSDIAKGRKDDPWNFEWNRLE